jgi:RNA polymerase primary sigma factor
MSELLIDLTDPAVRRIIKLAKKRGYVTHDELNRILRSGEFSLQQIQDVLGQLSEVGITLAQTAPTAREINRPSNRTG